jgi:TatD DNase family protein
VFGRILKACASEGGKILSVHSVRASSQVLDMIEENLPSGRGKVCLHWFTGSEREARRAVKLGCYFSINLEMLRKEHGLKLVSSLPTGRLLTETDGPFTTMDGRPLRPADSEMVLRELARVRNFSFEEMRSVLLTNLKNVTTPNVSSKVAPT